MEMTVLVTLVFFVMTVIVMTMVVIMHFIL